MNTIRDVARAFGTQNELADVLGVKRGRVEGWCRRNSIPSEWIARVVAVARERDIDLTADLLVEIMAANVADEAA